MNRKAFKLLERMRATKSGWRRRDLDELYESFGFIIEHGGNHDLVKHPDYPEIKPTSLPRHNQVLKVYIAFAIKQIDRLLELQAQTNPDTTVDSDQESEENNE